MSNPSELIKFYDNLPKKRSNSLTKTQAKYIKAKETVQQLYNDLAIYCTHAQADIVVTSDTPDNTSGNSGSWTTYNITCNVCKKRIFTITKPSYEY